MVDVLAILADGVQGDYHHVVCADLWSGRGRCRLRQVDGEVWDHQWACNVVTLQLGRSLDLLVMVLGLLVELIQAHPLGDLLLVMLLRARPRLNNYRLPRVIRELVALVVLALPRFVSCCVGAVMLVKAAILLAELDFRA